MSRRKELEEQYDMVDKRIREASPATPEEVTDAWRKELDSISFELNNLYDDDQDDDE